MFLKVGIAGLARGAGAVGDQKILRLQDQKRMMPDVRGIGDALVTARAKAAKPVKIRCAVIPVGRGHHHQPCLVRKRHEGLRAERMALHHRNGDGSRARRAGKDRQDRPATTRCNINSGQRVITGRRAFVNHHDLGAVTLDHRSERGKTGLGQRLYGEGSRGHHLPPSCG